jgi:hypothetical protein
MLRPGDPVNVGERCHLIVELADVTAATTSATDFGKACVESVGESAASPAHELV